MKAIFAQNQCIAPPDAAPFEAFQNATEGIADLTRSRLKEMHRQSQQIAAIEEGQAWND